MQCYFCYEKLNINNDKNILTRDISVKDNISVSDSNSVSNSISEYCCEKCIFSRYNEFSINGKISIIGDLDYYHFNKNITLENYDYEHFKLNIINNHVVLDELNLDFFKNYILYKYESGKCFCCCNENVNINSQNILYNISYKINTFKLELDNHFICQNCLFSHYFNSLYISDNTLVIQDNCREQFVLTDKIIKNKFYEIYIDLGGNLIKNILDPSIIHNRIKDEYTIEDTLIENMRNKEHNFKKCKSLADDLIEEILLYFRGIVLEQNLKSQKYIDLDNFYPIYFPKSYITCKQCGGKICSDTTYQLYTSIKTRGEYYIDDIFNTCLNCIKKGKFIVIQKDLYVKLNSYKKVLNISKVPDIDIKYIKKDCHYYLDD